MGGTGRLPDYIIKIIDRLSKQTKMVEQKERVLYTSKGDNCWGNAISHGETLVNEIGKKQSFHGWKSRRPTTGDFIQVPMTSGKHFLFEITEHEHCRDPPDMFFCTGVFLGYSEDYLKKLTNIKNEKDMGGGASGYKLDFRS